MKIYNDLIESSVEIDPNLKGLSVGVSYTVYVPPLNGLIVSGNVGIGTFLPSQQLQVIGNIIASGIVTSSSFFGNGTNLTNLNASNLFSGIVPSSVISGTYSGITSVGTLSQLKVTGITTLGVTSFTSAIYDNNNSQGLIGQVLSATATGVAWTTIVQSSGAITGSISSNQIAYGSGNNSIQGSNSLWFTGSRVGLGTSSPLDIFNVFANNNHIFFIGATNTFVGINTYIPYFINSAVGGGVGQQEAFTIYQGIGNTGFSLVAGIASVNSYSQIILINQSSGNNASADFVVQSNTGNESTNFVDMGINNSNYSQLNNYGQANDAYFYSTGNNLWIGNQSTNNIYFFTGNTPQWSSITRITITGLGSVGVGTTSPSQSLHVQGNVRINGSLSDSANSTGATGTLLRSTATGIAWSTSVQLGLVTGSAGANQLAYFANANQITGISTVVYSSGGIGVGTTNPISRLHLETTAAGNLGMNISGAASQTANLLQLTSTASGGGTKYFVISGTGQLGLGVQPTSQFTLSNTIAAGVSSVNATSTVSFSSSTILAGQSMANFRASSTYSGGSQAGSFIDGFQSYLTNSGTQQLGQLRNYFFTILGQTTGNILNAAQPICVYTLANGTGGLTTTVQSIYIRTDTSSIHTLQNQYGVYIDNPINSLGGSITNNYGVYIANQTSGASNYAIYSVGGVNYFGGPIWDVNQKPGSPIGVVTQFLASTGTGVTWAPVKRSLVMQLMTAFTPTSSGVDSGVFIVPQDPIDGSSSMNFTMKRVNIRVETPAAGITTINISKSTAAGVFLGTSILSSNINVTGASTYEFNSTTFTGFGATAVSGDKLSVNFIGTSASFANFTVQVIARET